MKNLKCHVAALLALALTLLAATAAAGNANIAMRGRDGFDDEIQNLFVAGDRLILTGYKGLYTWSEETGFAAVEGYDTGSLFAETVTEDGARRVTVGDEEIVLSDEYEQFTIYSGSVYAVGGRLYNMASVNGYDGFETMYLVELVLGNDGAVTAGDVIDLGDALIEDGGGYAEQVRIARMLDMGDVLCGTAYTDDGVSLVAIDPRDGGCAFMPLDIEGSIQGMAKWDARRVLIAAFDDGTGDCHLLRFDIDTGEMTALGELPAVNRNAPCALCWDGERGRLYCALGGSVYRMDITEEGLGEAEAFGDMPLALTSNAVGALLGDTYVVASREGVVGRDVKAEGMPDAHLVIENGAHMGIMRDASYDFQETYPQYAVSIRDSGSNGDAIVLAMLSRSDDVDLYTMSAHDSVFSSLMSRGYMAELGESEELTALVGAMYPALQDLCSKDGELYAVPLDLFVGSTLGYNRTLLERLGCGKDALPTSWEGLFHLIADLAADGRLKEEPEVSLLGSSGTPESARRSLFEQMMDDYFLWLDADPANLSRGSEALLRLCGAFERIDWEAAVGWGEGQGAEDIILELYASVLPSNRDAWVDVPGLSLLEDETPMLGARVSLAFVNPFSENREAAIKYLEKAAALIGQRTLITMCPDMNDPIENKDYEVIVKSGNEEIAAYAEWIAEAEEEGDDERLAMLTRNLEDLVRAHENYKANMRWNFSPEDIAAYREIAVYLQVERSSIWSEEETLAKMNQYLDGAIDKEQLARELERTIQMRRQEAQ